MVYCRSEILFNFVKLQVSVLHICNTQHSVLSWSVQLLLEAKIRILSAIPSTFGNSLKISSIFLWNMSPSRAVPQLVTCDISVATKVTRKCH